MISTTLNKPDHEQPKVLTQNIGDADLTYLLYDGTGPVLVSFTQQAFCPGCGIPCQILSTACTVIAPLLLRSP